MIKRQERSDRAGAVYDIAGYCMDLHCRRKRLLAYFGEEHGPCSEEEGEELCDVCEYEDVVSRQLAKLDIHVSHDFAGGKKASFKFKRDREGQNHAEEITSTRILPRNRTPDDNVDPTVAPSKDSDGQTSKDQPVCVHIKKRRGFVVPRRKPMS